MPGALKRIGIGIAEDPEKVIGSARAVRRNIARSSVTAAPGLSANAPAEMSIHIAEHAIPEQAMIDDLCAREDRCCCTGHATRQRNPEGTEKSRGC